MFGSFYISFISFRSKALPQYGGVCSFWHHQFIGSESSRGSQSFLLPWRQPMQQQCRASLQMCKLWRSGYISQLHRYLCLQHWLSMDWYNWYHLMNHSSIYLIVFINCLNFKISCFIDIDPGIYTFKVCIYKSKLRYLLS